MKLLMNNIIILGLVIFLQSCGVLAILSAATTVITTDADRRSVGVIADDDLMDFSLESWAFNDKKLADTHLNFTIYNKIVLVTGEVPNSAIQKYIDEQILIEEPSIKKVANATKIMKKTSLTSRANDGLIDGKITLKLSNQEVVNPTHIIVHTENSVVYLMGAVTPREGEKAGRIVAEVGGVEKVVKYFEYIEQIPQREIDRAEKREEIRERETREEQERLVE